LLHPAQAETVPAGAAGLARWCAGKLLCWQSPLLPRCCSAMLQPRRGDAAAGLNSEGSFLLPHCCGGFALRPRRFAACRRRITVLPHVAGVPRHHVAPATPRPLLAVAWSNAGLHRHGAWPKDTAAALLAPLARGGRRIARMALAHGALAEANRSRCGCQHTRGSYGNAHRRPPLPRSCYDAPWPAGASSGSDRAAYIL